MTTLRGRPLLGRAVGLLVLALSAMGYPLTRLSIRRFRRRGAVVAEGITTILLVRDATLVATGTLSVLRPAPALLLCLELAAAITATLSGLRLVIGRGAAGPAGHPTDALERARRASTFALFAIHTVRFWVYLQPDRGLSVARADMA